MPGRAVPRGDRRGSGSGVRTRSAQDVEELGWPVFVKPARAGSSLGITKVKGPADLDAADRGGPPARPQGGRRGGDRRPRDRVRGARSRWTAGRPRPACRARSGCVRGTSSTTSRPSTSTRTPSTSTARPTCRTRSSTASASWRPATFEALGCEGLARVDFFVTRTDEVLVNEINTMPGFTPFSMYPRMWEADRPVVPGARRPAPAARARPPDRPALIFRLRPLRRRPVGGDAPADGDPAVSRRRRGRSWGAPGRPARGPRAPRRRRSPGRTRRAPGPRRPAPGRNVTKVSGSASVADVSTQSTSSTDRHCCDVGASAGRPQRGRRSAATPRTAPRGRRAASGPRRAPRTARPRGRRRRPGRWKTARAARCRNHRRTRRAGRPSGRRRARDERQDGEAGSDVDDGARQRAGDALDVLDPGDDELAELVDAAPPRRGR